MPLFGRRTSFDQQAEPLRIRVRKRLVRSHTKSVCLPYAICPYSFINLSDNWHFPLLGNVLQALWPNEESSNGVAQYVCRPLPDICWHNTAEEWATGDTAPCSPAALLGGKGYEPL